MGFFHSFFYAQTEEMLCLCLSWDRHLHLTNIAGGGSHLVGNAPCLSHIRSCINPIVGLSRYRRIRSESSFSSSFSSFWCILGHSHFETLSATDSEAGCRLNGCRPGPCLNWKLVGPCWPSGPMSMGWFAFPHDFHITQCCPPKKMPELASLRQIDDLKRWSRCGSAPL